MVATWSTTQWVVFYTPAALLLVAGVVGWMLRKTIRGRVGLARQLRLDPDIAEFMIVFDWSRKVLYLPTIAGAIVCGILMTFLEEGGQASLILGGSWLGLFFLNFLVDEYEVSLKVLLIALLGLFLLCLWLVMLHWLEPVMSIFTKLRISISAAGFFVIAGIFFVAVAISWLKGLFFYAALTPNYLNLQTGPTETGEQINHLDFTTRINTGDFLERLLGFGKIIITFRDNRRPPIHLLVWNIGRRAKTLESIRGKIAIETHRTSM
jgi:hypothetical protein